MNSTYYICWYILDNQNYYLILHTNDIDGVYTENGKVLVFRTRDELVRFAEMSNIKIEAEEPILNDLDIVVRWLGHPNAEQIDCEAFNSAWNLFGDLSASVNGGFDPERKLTQKVYEKLFWGLNLPSVTPSGKQYEPIWTKAEVQLLRQVLTSGIDLFRASISVKI